VIVLGIDPGATTGWVLYDTDHRTAVSAGLFRGDDVPADVPSCGIDLVVIESLHDPRGNIYPAVVQAGITQGHIERQMRGLPLHRITRSAVKAILTEATLREPVVRDDKTAWQALVALHGEGSGNRPTKKQAGGCIGDVTSHQRAALAAVVAWCIRERLFVPAGAA
jgi:hypothetical protein